MDLQQETSLRQQNVEKLFAACLYQYPLYTFSECQWLEPEVFVNSQIKDFWAAAKNRLDTDISDERAAEIITEITLQSGAYLDFTDWGKNLADIPSPKAYANEISRRSYINLIMNRLPDITGYISLGDELALKGLFQSLAEEDYTGNITIPTALEISNKFEERVEKGSHSVMTNLPPLDAALGGLERKTLTVLAARPSMGKTALSLQIGRSIAALSPSRAAIFSLEMSSIALWARMACPRAGTTWRAVRANEVSPETRAAVQKSSRDLANEFRDKLLIIDETQTTNSIWRACAQNKPDIIVIDHLRFIKDKVGDNENKRLGIITEKLRDMAKSLDIAVLLLAQLNRKVEDRSDKRPTLTDLRDSGEIEENADQILMMYRDSYYSDDPPPNPDPTEVWVRKFRDGTPNTRINLLYDKPSSWFIPARAEEYNLRDITV
jgi:hypothetical protein